VQNSVINHTVDGRIYCTFNQLKRERDGGGDNQGTIARLSSASPNMQQVAGRKKDADDLLDIDDPIGPMVRGLFLPDEGDVWQCIDESQIEFRFLVNKAVGPGAEEAVRAYSDDPTTDYHKLTATMARIDPEDRVARRRVKNVNFSYVNGAGQGKIAELLQCSREDAEAFMELYNTRLPFVRQTYRAATAEAERTGVIETVLGRKQRFPFWEPRDNYGRDKSPPLPHDRALAEYGPSIRRAWAYRGTNRYISGSAADLMKKSMVDGWEAGVCGPLGAFLLTVHDELDLSVPPTSEAAEAAAELRHIMETCIRCRVPILTESKTGPDWGACA
jgi:DNA polymerase-1